MYKAGAWRGQVWPSRHLHTYSLGSGKTSPRSTMTCPGQSPRGRGCEQGTSWRNREMTEKLTHRGAQGGCCPRGSMWTTLGGRGMGALEQVGLCLSAWRGWGRGGCVEGGSQLCSFI